MIKLVLVAAPNQLQQSSNITISSSANRQKSLNTANNFIPNIPSSVSINNEVSNERVKSPDTISTNTFSSSATSSANTVIASNAYIAAQTSSIQPSILMSTPTAPMAIMADNSAILQRNNSIKSISKVLGVKLKFYLD